MKRLILVVALVSFLPSVAFAINLNLNYPDFDEFNLKDDQQLHQIVAFFYYLIVGISGLAAFVMLVWGGVQWLLSGAIPSQASEARDKVRNAIIGLLLVLASFLIIQVINPELTIIGIGDLLEVGSGELTEIMVCRHANCTGGSGDKAFLSPTGAYAEIDPSWNDEISALQITGPYHVEFYVDGQPSDLAYSGRAICFTESVNDLKQHVRGVSPQQNWNDTVSSIRIDPEEVGRCIQPAITRESRFTLRAVVSFYNEVDYGMREPLPPGWVSALPIEYFPESAKVYTGRQDIFEEDRNTDILSLKIAEGYAVRLWEQANNSAQTFSGRSVCFIESEPDLTIYSFDPGNPDNDIRDDIRGVEVIYPVDCENPKTVVP